MPDPEMKKKILVVEDEMDMRIFLITLIETNGYLPVTAKNGREGIEKAMETDPDLIILDMMMPVEGGALMIGRLAGEKKLSKTPVIVLSAVEKRTFYHYLKMMNARGEEKIPLPAAYIEKPPEAHELLKAIKTCI